jgi:hypothetical protein
MARLVGKHGRVISIEPIAEDAALLAHGARALRLPVTVLNCAISSSEGEAVLRVPLLGGSQKTALSRVIRARWRCGPSAPARWMRCWGAWTCR